jgi:hypothetical protein
VDEALDVDVTQTRTSREKILPLEILWYAVCSAGDVEVTKDEDKFAETRHFPIPGMIYSHCLKGGTKYNVMSNE